MKRYLLFLFLITNIASALHIDTTHQTQRIFRGQAYNSIKNEFKINSCVNIIESENVTNVEIPQFVVSYKNSKINSYEEVQKNSSLFASLGSAFKINLAQALLDKKSTEVFHIQLSIKRALINRFEARLNEAAQAFLVDVKDIVKFYNLCGTEFLIPEEEGYVIDVVAILKNSSKNKTTTFFNELNAELKDILSVYKEDKSQFSEKIDVDSLNKLLDLTTDFKKKKISDLEHTSINYEIKTNLPNLILKDFDFYQTSPNATYNCDDCGRIGASPMNVDETKKFIKNLDSDANNLFTKFFIDFPLAVKEQLINSGGMSLNATLLHPITRVKAVDYSDVLNSSSFSALRTFSIDTSTRIELETLLQLYKNQLNLIAERNLKSDSLLQLVEASLQTKKIRKRPFVRRKFFQVKELLSYLKEYNEALTKLCLSKTQNLVSCVALSQAVDSTKHDYIKDVINVNNVDKKFLHQQLLLAKEVQCLYHKDMNVISFCAQNNFKTLKCKNLRFHSFIQNKTGDEKTKTQPQNPLQIDGNCKKVGSIEKLQISQPFSELFMSNY